MKTAKLSMLMLAFVIVAGAAQATEKTLNLSVRESEFFLGDRPFLSVVNGPISAEEKSLSVTLDMEKLIELTKKYHNVEQQGSFYREKRNFRNAYAIIRVHYVDNFETVQRFEIREGATSEAKVSILKIIKNVSAEFIGESDVYKCFNSNTCVFEGTKGNFIRVEGLVGIYPYRSLIRCEKDALVEGHIYTPNIQRIILSPSLISELQLLGHNLEEKGEAVVTGEAFKSLTNIISNYDISPGFTSQSNVPDRIFYVEKDKNALRMRVEHKAFYYCIYEHKLYPNVTLQKRTTPIGFPCPLEDSLFKLKETAPGLKAYSKEVLLESCVNAS